MCPGDRIFSINNTENNRKLSKPKKKHIISCKPTPKGVRLLPIPYPPYRAASVGISKDQAIILLLTFTG